MTKTKTPFFSLTSHGTLADSITSQKRGTATLLRRRPAPTDPKSLAQIYQRWDYQDQAYLWHFLSVVGKQSYEQQARPFHMTGFAFWMRTRLNTLPDIVVRYRMDIAHLPHVPDVGKGGYDATRYGASGVDGVISNALSFDGLDDYITTGIVAPPWPDIFTVEFWYKHLSGFVPCVAFKSAVSPPYLSPAEMAGRSIIALGDNNYKYFNHVPLDVDDGEWHLLHFQVPGGDQNDIINAELYADTQLQTTLWDVHTGSQLAKERLDIGRLYDYHHNCLIDHFTLYNRLLDATERQRHYERSYP